jgi:beta-lactamase superfamily II metal-dependent hydrolase
MRADKRPNVFTDVGAIRFLERNNDMNQNILYVNLGGGSVLQYANRDPYQMMGYLIKTPDGKTVMIDSGRTEGKDAAYLYDLLQKEGGRVDLWLITHAHNDHFGALAYLLRTMEHFDLEIADMRFSFPPTEWLKGVEGGGSYAPTVEFLSLLQKHGIPVTPLHTGDVLTCGGLTIDVLHDSTSYASYDNINDTSAVLRVHFPRRDVLFLGDLGWVAGAELAAACGEAALRCDIVQMAHHGQNGADRAFYEIVRPKIALYTAPRWLWDCDNGGGVGSGPWKTLETRRWLDELGVQISCPHAYGDYLLL